jgi:hypothetical protein
MGPARHLHMHVQHQRRCCALFDSSSSVALAHSLPSTRSGAGSILVLHLAFGGCRRSCRQKDRNTLAAARRRSASQWIQCIGSSLRRCVAVRVPPGSSTSHFRLSALRRCESIPARVLRCNFMVVEFCKRRGGRSRRNSDGPPPPSSRGADRARGWRGVASRCGERVPRAVASNS